MKMKARERSYTDGIWKIKRDDDNIRRFKFKKFICVFG